MKLMRYRTVEGVYTVLLVKEGRRWAQVVFMDAGGIRIKRVPVADVALYMWQVQDYPIRRAIRRFLDAGTRFGITRGCKVALKEARKQSKQHAVAGVDMEAVVIHCAASPTTEVKS